MGITICDENFYVVSTVDQAYLFLSFDAIYALCELLFIYKTVQLCWNKGITADSWELVGFYISMHLVFIRACLFLLGGAVICYSENVYQVLETYCFIFKRIGLFLLSYRMAKLLRQMENEEDTSVKEILILVLAVCDVVAFSTLFWMDVDSKVFYVYVLVLELLLTTIFVLTARSVANKMKSVMSYATQSFLWKVFILIMLVAFFVRAAQATFNMLHTRYAAKKSFVYGLYHALYMLITEIIPSLLMIWIISNSTEESPSNRDSLFSSQHSDIV